MPKAMKDMLFKPQGNAGSTPATQATPTAQSATVSQTQTVTVDNNAQVQAELNKRNSDIKAVFAPFGTTHNDLLVECLGDLSITAEQARHQARQWLIMLIMVILLATV